MAGAPQGGNQSDNSASILWTVAALFALVGGIWFFFRDSIIHLYMAIKLFELNLLRPIMDVPWLSWVFPKGKMSIDTLSSLIYTILANPKVATAHDVMLVGGQVGGYVSTLFAVLLIGLAFIVYFGNTTRVYKRLYDMNMLAGFEKINWPQISPVLGLNLLKTDIDKGPWAMAMTPMQFCKRFQIIQEVRPVRREGMSRKEWDRIDVVLRRGEANRLFALQLGTLWNGTDRLPMYLKALFAIFAARINASTKDATKLIRQLNASSTGKLNFAGVNELCRKFENTKLVQQRISIHAYTLTVMASMLEGAREDGVQATADFLWLKPIDRRAWYTLNSVGRQTPFVEVAGVFAHWLAEREAGHRLVMPMVEEATKALELALLDVVYQPDEDSR